ncbi:hypothetical protein EVAR_83374_1 [Eumeta japonica]|uniref:Uncharacterized protein n=1 Tax=Eumeta variegata TaxID=151549 RepID=A0A4C1TYC8_EUMVA|nr:hypothetical protein EVAR_83374_1 [Eumeta japonica]
MRNIHLNFPLGGGRGEIGSRSNCESPMRARREPSSERHKHIHTHTEKEREIGAGREQRQPSVTDAMTKTGTDGLTLRDTDQVF